MNDDGDCDCDIPVPKAEDCPLVKDGVIHPEAWSTKDCKECEEMGCEFMPSCRKEEHKADMWDMMYPDGPDDGYSGLLNDY